MFRLPAGAHDFHRNGAFLGRDFGETANMNVVLRKSRSVILYGSSVALGLILCKAWFFAQIV